MIWRDRSAENRRAYLKKRKAYIMGYGGECSCCGETSIEFLDVHHVHGGGGAAREKAGKGANYMRLQIKLGFPPGKIVYCANCHAAIERYGSCPHKSNASDRDMN